MKKGISIFLLFVFFLLDASAQDPEFTNYYSNPLYLNPAYSGGSADPAVFMNYRNQWPGMSGTFVTYMVGIDIPVDKISGGIGLNFTNDRSGSALNTKTVAVSYAQSINITKNISVRPAASIGYINKKLDFNQLTFGDMIDPRRGFIYSSYYLPFKEEIHLIDFAGGLLATGKTFNIGFAIHHILEPNESFIEGQYSPLPRKYTMHASKTFTSGKFNFSPLLLYTRQQDFSLMNIGCYINRGLFSTGLLYRDKDAFILSAGFRQKYFRFGYSYDVTTSKLGMKTLGSHEVYLAVVMPAGINTKKLKVANLPVF